MTTTADVFELVPLIPSLSMSSLRPDVPANANLHLHHVGRDLAGLLDLLSQVL